MKAYLFYNRQTAAERKMQDFQERLSRAEVDTELMEADSPRAVTILETFDVMARPAVILVRTDGSLVQSWQGEDGLPTVNDVSYLAHQ